MYCCLRPDDSRVGTKHHCCRSYCCYSDLFNYDDDDDNAATTTVIVMLIITVWTWMIDNIHSIGFYERKRGREVVR